MARNRVSRTDLVEFHSHVWSGDVRHDCAIAGPYCHGHFVWFGPKQSPWHRLKCMCRPLAFIAADILGYTTEGSAPLVWHQSACANADAGEDEGRGV